MTKRIIAVFLALITVFSMFTIVANAASYKTGNYLIASSSGSNIRTGAGTGYSKVGAASKGTTFYVSKISGSWGYTSSIKCTNGTKSGWVCLDYCTYKSGHTHNYNGGRYYENAHPHAITVRCTSYNSCGGWKATGEYYKVSSCSKCYPNKVKKTSKNGVVYTYVTKKADTGSLESWVSSMKKNESSLCTIAGGVIVGAKVVKTKTVTWNVPKNSKYQGPGVSGTTKVKYVVPEIIEYKLHSHTRNRGFGKSWYYSNGCIITTYSCNCGYRKELMSWEIPLPDFSGSQTTKSVIQGLPQINK